jgi:hypothetical protein
MIVCPYLHFATHVLEMLFNNAQLILFNIFLVYYAQSLSICQVISYFEGRGGRAVVRFGRLSMVMFDILANSTAIAQACYPSSYR